MDLVTAAGENDRAAYFLYVVLVHEAAGGLSSVASFLSHGLEWN